jgi:hypothetical protein
VLSSGAVAKSCCLDACGIPLLDGCGFPFYDACGNPTSGYSGEGCPTAQIASNDINECVDGCGSPVTGTYGSPVNQCCLDGCGSPLLDACGFPWLDACGNPALNANGDACTTIGMNVCLGEQSDGGDSSLSFFPPAVNSLQCEGLVSVCTITSFNVSEACLINSCILLLCLTATFSVIKGYFFQRRNSFQLQCWSSQPHKQDGSQNAK